MKIWTMTRSATYEGTGEVYLVTTAHMTYRGAVKAAREELEYFAETRCSDRSARDLLAAYADGRRSARPDGNWFDCCDYDLRLVVSIVRTEVAG